MNTPERLLPHSERLIKEPGDRLMACGMVDVLNHPAESDASGCQAVTPWLEDVQETGGEESRPPVANRLVIGKVNLTGG